MLTIAILAEIDISIINLVKKTPLYFQ